MPTYSTPYIKSLLEEEKDRLKRPINIMDLGSSYGIISSLMTKNITWTQLIDFYVDDGKEKEHSWADISSFYKSADNQNNQYNFYLIDNSKPAIDFSEKMGLCKQGYVLDLRNDRVSGDLSEKIKEIDIFISTGSIVYIGTHFFKEILPILAENKKYPLFLFSAHLIFYNIHASKLEELFSEYGYHLIYSDKLCKGRRMLDDEIKTLKDKGNKLPDICQFENEGYFTAGFFMAVPQEKTEHYIKWIEQI